VSLALFKQNQELMLFIILFCFTYLTLPLFSHCLTNGTTFSKYGIEQLVFVFHFV